MRADNPYEPTKSGLDYVELTELRVRPWSLVVQSVIQAALAVGLSIQAPAMMAEFTSLFAGFGADVPAGTRFLLAHPGLWWLFAAAGIAIAAWALKRNRVAYREQRRMKVAVRGFGVLLAIAVALTIVALYLPVFRLGAPA